MCEVNQGRQVRENGLLVKENQQSVAYRLAQASREKKTLVDRTSSLFLSLALARQLYIDMKETEPSTNEREFLLAALKEGARIDGRSFYDFRSLRLSFGADYGNVEVQLGNTRCVLVPSVAKSNPTMLADVVY